VLNTKIRLSFYFFLTSIVFIFDQISKDLALTHLKAGRSIDLFGDFFRFSLARNPAGMFSTRIGSNTVYIIFGIAGIIFIVIYAFQLFRKKNILYDIGIPLLLAGALGNITDRFNHALVTDFIDVGIGPHRWPTFNIADSSILIGLFIIFIAELKSKDGKEDKTNGSGGISSNTVGSLSDSIGDTSLPLEDSETDSR